MKTTVQITIHIAQPPEIVAQAMLEPANAVLWTAGLQRFEVVSRVPGDVGSVAHLHYLRGGRPYIMEDVLEYAEPNRRYVSRVSGGGLSARVETTLTPAGGGTQVTVRWSGSGTSPMMRLLLPFMRGAVARGAEADLRTFKQLVETHGPRFPSRSPEEAPP